ncbi:MAG TPA: MFS transporter [Kribbella sp.]|nr:MFS transporter [Kribbella sp.]
MSPTSPRAAAALLMLSVGTFSYVTIEVLPIGLLTVMAGDLHRSDSRIGLLVSGYAVIVVLTSIPLTRLTSRLPRRTVLSGTLAVVAVANLLAAAAPTYEVLFGARLVTALSQALFWSIAPSIATSLVPPDAQGRAVARISIGAALASVLGVPLGTWLGANTSWRIPFLITAGLGAALFVGAMSLLPKVEAQDTTSRRGKAPDARRYAAVVAAAAIGVTGFMTFNTYVTPFLLDLTGFGRNALGPVLLASGLGGVLGAMVVGRLLDSHAWAAQLHAIALLALTLLGLAAFGQWKVPTVAFIAVGGFAYSSMAVALQARTLQVAHISTSLASAGTNSAYNLGIAAGAFVGGVLIDHTPVRTVAVVGGLLLAATALVVLCEPLMSRVPQSQHALCEDPA